MDIVTAITGASGALYAQRFIQGLVAAGVNTHLVVSPLGRRLLHDELGMETVDLEALAGWILEDALPVRFQVQIHKLIWGPERKGV